MSESVSPVSVEKVHFASSQELGKIFDALAKAQGEMVPAVLDMVNPHYKSKYASLTSCMEACQKPLSKNGLCISQAVFTLDQHFYVRTTLGHSSGQWMSGTLRLLIGKQDMQGVGSAITYAKRYGLCSMVGIVDTEDDDGNASLPEKKILKNHAEVFPKPPPPPAEEIDRALAGDADEEARMELIADLMQAVRDAGIKDEEARMIIKAKTGKGSSKLLDLKELKSVIKFIRESYKPE